MFKSIQESFRSLLSTSTNDNNQPVGTKRKRSFCLDSDEEDPDVQIIKVEKRRKQYHNPFLSIFNKMGDWIKFKPRPFSDQFSTLARRSDPKSDSKDSLSKINGAPSRHVHANRSKRYDNMVHQKIVHSSENKRFGNEIINDSNSSIMNGERRSSTSSKGKPSHNYSFSRECIRLNEKEEYYRLLQMQKKLSSSPSRMSASAKESDALSVSSCSSSADISVFGTSTALSQARQLSNVTIRSPRGYKYPPNRPTSHLESDSSKNWRKYPVPSRPSMLSLIGEQKRRLGFESSTPGNNSRSPELSKPPKEATEFPPSKDSLVIIDDDDEDGGDSGATKSKDVKSSGDSNIVNNGVSSRPQHKSLDFRDSMFMKPSYTEELRNSRLMHSDQWKRQVEEEEMKVKAYEEKRFAQGIELERLLKHKMRIFEKEPEVTQAIFIEKGEEEGEEILPELTDDMMAVVKSVLGSGPPGDLQSEAFRIRITRKDMATLAGLNWLNDEIINFYMNMLMERGEQEGMAKVYAFNTFFYPKIMSGGHSAVKRWTKKVDIFDMHFVLIPVHLGMHWCLCVADMKNKTISYYDSMAGKNSQCLKAVLKYINDESVVKKQQPIDTSEWKLETVQDNPQQLNGSDCGMFSCKYAEYITRQKKITFTQKDMPYFRLRMVYEIKTKRLLQ